jgi:K+-sensing histidine kinase KdpD
VTVLDHAQTSFVGGGRDVDTIRALCHDLRQPLAAILLLAGSANGDTELRLRGIVEQARWLADLVDDVLVEAANDSVRVIDVSSLTELVVSRAKPTAGCQITVESRGVTDAVGRTVALGRAIGCLVDNGVRAAGPGGTVAVVVDGLGGEVVVSVADDGPGLGHVPPQNSLGLTITRALVAACEGRFDLRPGRVQGVVAEIVLHRALRRSTPRAVAS